MNRRKKGFTLIELMIVVAIIAIIAAIAIPNLLRSRIAANEAAAIGALRTLSSAQENYRNNSGTNVYGTLALLSGATPPYIDSALGSGISRGYTVAIVGTPDANSWAATALPNAVGTTGNRGFFIDQSGVIRFTTDGTAPTTASLSLNQ
jgi:prepilin-type N-terminal cleavage/methylation domain-containing protein